MARAKNNEIRYQILTVAKDMFQERGYDSVLMKDIAGECSITPALLQHYFSKKEDILVHIVYSFVYWTAAFLNRNRQLFEKPEEYREYLWCGSYYRLLYTMLCNNNQKVLKMYTEVLFNTPLLQRGMVLSVEALQNLGIPLADTYHSMLRIFILNGSLSQLVAMHYRGGTLTATPAAIVNRALSVYLRDQRFEKEEEIFDILDKRLNDSVLAAYLEFMDRNNNQFILL